MTAAERLAKRVRPELESAAAAENLAAANRHIDRALDILRPYSSLRHKIPKPPPPGKPREERRAAEDRTEASGKRDARKRAEQEGSPRCEWFTNGERCASYGSDCDHVLGGTHKKEMEALPNGEGFQVECRTHHMLKHGPGKAGHLAQAKEHAIRIGSRGLRRAVEQATAIFEGKHGRSA